MLKLQRLTADEKLQQDKRVILHLLWVMPLLSVKEMAVVLALSEHRCWLVLDELMKEQRVRRAVLGRRRGARYRYWLSSRTVREVALEEGQPIPWQVTESGLRQLVRRLPMLEEFYALAPGLWSHAGVKADCWIVSASSPFEDRVMVARDQKLFTFRWVREGQIHAIVEYQDSIWVAMVWVGSTLTEHRVKERGARAVQEIGARCVPAGWVLVGHDRLAACQAARFWPADNVLAVDVHGRVERRMRPGDFGLTPRQPTEDAKLGNPDALVRWLDRNNSNHSRAMIALNAPLNYRVFRFIAEWHDATPGQLEWHFGDSCRAAIRELRAAGLVMILDGGYYLTDAGRKTVAQMDRVSPKDILRRVRTYMDLNSDYHAQQQDHHRSTIAVAMVLGYDQVDVFAGFRGLRHIKGVTRVAPDGIVCLDCRDSSSFLAYLEVEFTADGPSESRNKHRPYLRLQDYSGDDVGLFYVARDERAERTAQLEGAALPMLVTSTWPRLIEWPSRPEDEAWQNEGDPVDTRWMVKHWELVQDVLAKMSDS